MAMLRNKLVFNSLGTTERNGFDFVEGNAAVRRGYDIVTDKDT